MDKEQVEVTFDSNNKIIVLNALICPTVKTMRESVINFMELSTIHNCKSVLIDATRTKSLPSIVDMYTFGSKLAKIPGLQYLRFAFALSDDIFDDFKFFNDVIANRGIYVHIFKDFDKARDWLLRRKNF
jgi:hypothetical protein